MFMMKRLRDRRNDAGGFTLIEVLTTAAILSIVLTLGALALRHFWLTRAVTAARDDVVTGLRATQERVVSESWPYVYGALFDPGSDGWNVIRYDPVNPGNADDTCKTVESHDLGDQVVVQTVSFDLDTYITGFCKSQIGAPADAAIALFYSRGSATEGQVVLEQTALGKTATVTVDGITGRVTDQ